MIHPPQEPDVLPGRALTGVGAGVVVSIVLGVIIAMAIGRCESRQLGIEWVPPIASPKITGVINAMETAPFSVEALGFDQHRLEDARLRGYGWVDRTHQIVHVPVEVAIDLYLAKQQQAGGGK
jgi:hypothetical protein